MKIKKELNNDVSNNDISNNDVSNNDASNNDASNNDVSNNDVSNNDISNKKINKDILKKNKYVLIKLTIFLLIFECLLLLLVLDNLRDRLILYFALYGQILLIYSLLNNKPFLIEVSHIIFGVSLLLVLFCSFEPILNIFCYNVILITIATRYFYSDCLFLNCNENNISFMPKNLNYGFVYLNLFCLLIFKIIYIFFKN